MNVRNAHAALALGAALMVTLNGATHAQTANTAKTGGAKTAAKSTKARAALPPTKASKLRVSIDAKNAPVQKALEQVFRDAKAEYILDNGVGGYVTLKVTNQPFENALALLLRASSSPLTYSRDGDVYIVHAARRNVTAAATPNTTVSNLVPTDPPLAEIPGDVVAPAVTTLPTGDISTPLGIISGQGVGNTPNYMVNTGGFGPPPAVTISPAVPSNNGLNNTYFSPSFNTGVSPMYNVGGTYFAPPWFQTNNGYYFPYYGYGN